MTPPPRHARGRHAGPPSAFATKCRALIRAASTGRGRRKTVAAATGTATVALLAVAAAVGLSATGGPSRESRARPDAARPGTPERPYAQSPAQTQAQARARPADPDDVPDAVTYFRQKDPRAKVAKHVKRVRRSGPFLRVYTDLPEGEENSRDAVSLCEWTTEFLKSRMGDARPVVFVHAEENGNGNVVLANKQSPKDDCKVGETR